MHEPGAHDRAAMIRTMNDGAKKSSIHPLVAASPKAPSGRQRVLEAAEKLFAARGFLGTSAADIAREAGVAHGLLFHHFGSMEKLYAEVTRAAANRMDDLQAVAFRGATPREQVATFLRTHVRAVKQRQGDAIFRARSTDVAVSNDIAKIWEGSRLRAMDQVFQVLGITKPTKKMRVCLRGWIGFHDQLVLGWLADRSISETEVLDLTMRQLEVLASEVFGVDLGVNRQ